MFGSLSIGRRVGIGFVMMLILLGLVLTVAAIGISNIVNSAEDLLEHNRLRTYLMEREIDHLEWQDGLYIFVTDRKVNTLSIELDHNKCNFGKWLYSSKRQQAENQVPALIPLFKAIEKPHQLLHLSALKIKQILHYSDHNLPQIFLEHILKHALWLNELSDAIHNNQLLPANSIDVKQCPLEKWLKGEYAQIFIAHLHSEFKEQWQQMQLAHNALHQSASHIMDRIKMSDVALTSPTPEQIFFTDTLPNLHEMLISMSVLEHTAALDLRDEEQAEKIFNTESMPNHLRMQKLLHQIRNVVNDNTITDEKMLLLSRQTLISISGIGIIAIFLASLMTVRIRRDIVLPLHYLGMQLTTCYLDKSGATNPNFSHKLSEHLGVLKFFHENSFTSILRAWRFRTSNSSAYEEFPDTVNNKNAAQSLADQLYIAPNIPEEIETLARAVSCYTEYQSNVAAAQQKFIANVAHQIKNPLAGIYMQMDLIIDDSKTSTAAQIERLHKLRNSIHRLGRLTHQLLALARCSPEAISSKIMKTIQLDQLIEERASEWFDAALVKQIDLGFEIEPVQIHGLAWLISEMLSNLIDNSIKYTPANGKITLRCGRRLNAQPFVEIEDNGPGISTVDHNRIFERFYRAEATEDTRASDSLGLGLAIVKEVVEHHHATIRVGTPNSSTGTRFIIEFPHLRTRSFPRTGERCI